MMLLLLLLVLSKVWVLLWEKHTQLGSLPLCKHVTCSRGALLAFSIQLILLL